MVTLPESFLLDQFFSESIAIFSYYRIFLQIEKSGSCVLTYHSFFKCPQYKIVLLCIDLHHVFAFWLVFEKKKVIISEIRFLLYGLQKLSIVLQISLNGILTRVLQFNSKNFRTMSYLFRNDPAWVLFIEDPVNVWIMKVFETQGNILCEL